MNAQIFEPQPKRWLRMGLFLLLLISLVGCQVFSPPSPAPANPTARLAEPTSNMAPTSPPSLPTEPAQTETPPAEPAPTLAVPAEAIQAKLNFATYQEPPVNTAVSLPPMQVQPRLENVYNPFVLSAGQMERLAQIGFVVSPGTEKEFFTVYEKARYANVPIFVTSDSLLHSYHLLFDKVLRTAETQRFIPLLQEMNAALLQEVDGQYQELKGTPLEEAARRTVAYVAVATRLLDPQAQIPAYAAELAEAELAQIEAASGILPSPIFPGYTYGEDYTQYIPRGHYTRSDALKAYFKSMMWYGRMSFRLKPDNVEAGKLETRMGLLLLNALRSIQVDKRSGLEAWADLYNPTVFFVGRSDDLTMLQYIPVYDAIYGENAPLTGLGDEAQLGRFIEEANKLPPPLILGMVTNIEEDEVKTTKGLRFMGQRFVPDAYIFRQLIYRNVGTPDNRRGLPKGLDVMAAMGSERAYQHLESMGETSYPNYPEQMTKVRSWLGGLTEQDWTETLYNSWLYTFFPLLEPVPEGYPAFMRTVEWQDKQLNTALGSWAELKHDTILYAKQVYAEMGGGPPPPEPVPPKGYVEPVPQFYARLTALTQMTRQGLESRGLLTENDMDNLQTLENLSKALQKMAEKELRGEPLTEDEFYTIRFIGGELEHIVMRSADQENEDPTAPEAPLYMDEEPQAAVVADVATDPNPNNVGSPDPVVLEEAVGRINEIYAVVPLIQEDGSAFLQIAKGGVFSYYEFPWPADDRLTDEKWRTMLDNGQAPDLPAWTAGYFTPETEYSGLQSGIQQFQDALVYAFWDPGYATFDGALSAFQSEVEALRDSSQYAGRTLVRANFLSYDRQSETQAVVTVQETWEDARYPGISPEFGIEPNARRGPYTLTATYVLQLVQESWGPVWQVTSVRYAETAPEWVEP